MRHLMTVDVEDYFQVEAFAEIVPRDSWDFWPCRVVESTRAVLDLFDRHETKATFFFLGWIAKKFPALVREVQGRGHELACHSFWHRRIYSLTPEEFRRDTQQAKDVIEQASGAQVIGYRAPSWTITNKSMWALDLLAEMGFLYDSSIYPIRHDIYGVPGAHRLPHTLSCGNGKSLREFPPTTVRIAGVTLPAAGGGYLRVLPFRYNEFAFRQMITKHQRPVVVYFHPWEFDPDQPRIRAKLRSTFRHYTNLGKMQGRVGKLLEQYSFGTFRSVLEQNGALKNSSTTDSNNYKETLEVGLWEPDIAK
jgi:polysaccharide deacetylase family protein (PEP-CTERM system associated)